MRKQDAVRYYGGVEENAYARIAQVLELSRQAVQKWPPVVPPASALQLELATKGELKVRPELYRKRRRSR